MHPAGILLIVFIVIAALLLIRSEWEKRQLRTEFYEIETGKLQKGARFVFLSDLHDARFGADNAELLRQIEALSPDAVLLGGDMITTGKHTQSPPKTDVCLRLIERLSARYPVYYAEGNHETRLRERFPDTYEIFTHHLMQLGVEYIKDGCEVFDTEDLIEDDADDIKLYGASLDMKYFASLQPGIDRRMPMPEGYLSEKLGAADRAHFNILLLHSPLYLKEAARWGADLVLSGHFHGGTIRLPFVGGLMTPQLQFLVKECAGRFAEDGCEMIVSRGLGTHSVRIRLNDLPELSCIDIVPSLKGRRG